MQASISLPLSLKTVPLRAIYLFLFIYIFGGNG